MTHRRRSKLTVAEISVRSIGATFQWEARMMNGAYHVKLSSEDYNAILTIIAAANERAVVAAGIAGAHSQSAGRSVSVLRRRGIHRPSDGNSG